MLKSLEIQKKYIESYQSQLRIIDTNINELKRAKETIEGYTKLEENEEILVPVGANMFVFGKIADTRKVLSHVGANILVKENATKALERLTNRIHSLSEIKEKMEKELSSVVEQYRNLSRKVEEQYAEMLKKEKK